jgi:polar amino acid transport system permease protein
MNLSTFLPSIPVLLQGLGTTLLLSLSAAALATVIGVLAAAARFSRVPIIAQIAYLYVQVFRGTPLLITLLFVYFGTAGLGLHVNLFVAAALGLSIYTGAYIGEIIRAGLEAVPKSQWEASQILGLKGTSTFINVIMPQTGRVVLPPLFGQYIALIKDSSLASMIGAAELMRHGQAIIDRIGQPIVVYAGVAVLYFIVCYPLSLWVRHLEKRSLAA